MAFNSLNYINLATDTVLLNTEVNSSFVALIHFLSHICTNFVQMSSLLHCLTCQSKITDNVSSWTFVWLV